MEPVSEGETEFVGEKLAVEVCEREAPCDSDGVRVGDGVCVPEGDAPCVSEGVALELALYWRQVVQLAVADCVGVFVGVCVLQWSARRGNLRGGARTRVRNDTPCVRACPHTRAQKGAQMCFAHARGPGTHCEGVGVPVCDGVRVGVCEVVSVPVRVMLLVLEKLVLGVRVCVGVLVGVLELERVTVSPTEAVVEGEKDGEEVKETVTEAEPVLELEMLSLIVGVTVDEGVGVLVSVAVDVKESEGDPETVGGVVAVLVVEPEAEAEGEGVSVPVEEAEPEAEAEGVGVCEGVRVGEVSVCEMEDV